MPLPKLTGRNVWLTAGAILLLAVAAYIPAVTGRFVGDDKALIIDDARVQSADGLWNIWAARGGTTYSPVTTSVFWVQWRLWGTHTAGYHLATLLMHGLAAALVFLTLRRLKVPGALVAAAIFAVHPVNVESAAWICQLKNTLAMVFFLLTILAYLKFERRTERLAGHMDVKWYVVSLVLFALALLSRPAVVMLPVVLLGLAWWRRSRVARRDLVRSVPFFALSLGIGLVTMSVRAIGENPIRPEVEGFFTKLAISGMAVWFYLYKAVVPLGLSFVYPRWQVDGGAVVSYVPVVLLAGCFAALWLARKTWWGRPVLAATGYFVIVLFPLLGFFDNSYWSHSLVADRYQYFSLVAVIALAVAGGAKLFGSPGTQRGNAGLAVAVTGVVVLAALTWHRAGLFADPVAIWQDTVNRNPDSWYTRNGLGGALLRSERPDRFDRAGEHLARALALTKDEVGVWMNNGVLLYQTGQFRGAVAYCREALRLDQGHVPAHMQIGEALVGLGEYNEAIKHYTEAIRLRPYAVAGYVGLAAALREANRVDEAVKYLTYALKLEPWNFELHVEMGVALATGERLAESGDAFAAAVAINPDNAYARYCLGRIFNELGRSDEALEHLRICVRLAPDVSGVYFELGRAMKAGGNALAAAEHFAMALQLDPDSDEAAELLTGTLIGMGRYAEAAEQLGRTIMLRPDHVPHRLRLVRVLLKQGKGAEAVGQYREIIDRNGGSPETVSALAWLLATWPDEKVRNGAEAVRLAEWACEQTARGAPALLDTLGAAYAEVGRFDDAVQTARETVRLAQFAATSQPSAEQSKLLDEYRKRLKLYQAKRPYRQRPADRLPTSQPADAACLVPRLALPRLACKPCLPSRDHFRCQPTRFASPDRSGWHPSIER